MTRNATRILTVAVGFAAQGLFNACALGGLVIFAPSAVEVTPGTPVTMEVTLQAEQYPGFWGADVLIGSDDIPFTFEYSEPFRREMMYIKGPFLQSGIYQYDVLVGGSNSSRTVGSSLMLGIIRVDTTDLASGEYLIMVDYDIDQVSQMVWLYSVTGLLYFEPLHGQVSITVVPEPGTLLLLAPVLCAFVKLTRERDESRGSR